MRREAKYSHEDLKQLFLDVENKIKRIPKSDEFVNLGLPDIGYYKRAFGTYGSFLKMIGRDVEIRKNRTKSNPKRFFYPQEWINLLNNISNDNHKFWFELLLHTGARFNEVRNIKVMDINLEKEFIFISKPKGGRGRERTIQISSYLKNRIQSFIKLNKLDDENTLLLNEDKKSVSNQGVDKQLKRYCRLSGIKDWKDFSCHNIRKTTEMWLISLGINHLAIVAHLGHTILVASTYYVSTQLFSKEDIILIGTIFGNLLRKNN